MHTRPEKASKYPDSVWPGHHARAHGGRTLRSVGDHREWEYGVQVRDPAAFVALLGETVVMMGGGFDPGSAEYTDSGSTTYLHRSPEEVCDRLLRGEDIRSAKIARWTVRRPPRIAAEFHAVSGSTLRKSRTYEAAFSCLPVPLEGCHRLVDISAKYATRTVRSRFQDVFDASTDNFVGACEIMLQQSRSTELEVRVFLGALETSDSESLEEVRAAIAGPRKPEAALLRARSFEGIDWGVLARFKGISARVQGGGYMDGPGHDPHRLVKFNEAMVRAFERMEWADMDLSSGAATGGQVWDVFISHASEDKESIVRPLASELRARGIRVWFDEYELEIGDSLRASIENGLARSQRGVVVISPAFFAKHWTQEELNGLVALEAAERRYRVLPVWHNVGHADVARQAPMLAGRVAVTTDQSLEQVVDKLVKVLSRPGS